MRLETFSFGWLIVFAQSIFLFGQMRFNLEDEILPRIFYFRVFVYQYARSFFERIVSYSWITRSTMDHDFHSIYVFNSVKIIQRDRISFRSSNLTVYIKSRNFPFARVNETLCAVSLIG